MNTAPQAESLDQIVNSFAQRIARVIVARTIQELFSGKLAAMGSMNPEQLMLSAHDITDPSAVLGGTVSPRRRLRRSGESVDKDVAKIVAALVVAKRPMRAEELREAAGLSKAEMLLPMKRALETKQIGKRGQKRATTYSIPGAAAASEPASESDSIPATSFAGKNVIRRKGKKQK